MRVVLGLIITTAAQVWENPALVVPQVVLSGSVLLLLIGDASKPRMAVGSALFGLYALVAVVGISAAVTGRNPLADQWLTRPELDAHIIVINEYHPSGVVHVDDYADAVANNLKLRLRGTDVPVQQAPFAVTRRRSG